MVKPTLYDVIVVGIGAHGSSILDTLARRGLNVLGIEKFDIAHAMGSSHGNSRIFRTAYIEDPRYVPLLKRSLALWHELQEYRNSSTLSPATVIKMTKGLMIGKLDSGVVQGTLASVKEHDLQHRVLTANEMRAAYPAFAVRDNEVGVLDESSGYVVPETAIETLVHRAVENGAHIKTKTTVTSWREEEEGYGKFVVETSSGETLRAAKGVLSVGAWANEVYGFEDLLKVERRVLHWFKPSDLELYRNLPVWIWQYETGSGKQGAALYGFPHQPGYSHAEGVKIARHGLGKDGSGGTKDNLFPESPNELDRDVEEGEIELMKSIVGPLLPTLAGESVATETCMYTMTPNEDFLVDLKPGGKVVYVSPCSGHGFKMVPCMGEIVADLAMNGRTEYDISFMGVEELRKWKGKGAK